MGGPLSMSPKARPLALARGVGLVAVAVALLAFGGCGRTEYGGVDLSAYVPKAYVADVKISLGRAGDNGPELLDAITEAPEQDRAALAFLISNLPSVDLATADAGLLLETVSLAREARERFPWGRAIPESVYQRYVLPPRVSQEPLENWRPYLLGQLTTRLEGVDSMEEAALEVNRWCGERVGFKPTQRRDQGVFETLASGYGRCEEMMIVHIAALRSVAIPARQAWTPFWTTCDNNHAWTELWVDGDWHYTGACEPRDALDDAWFNERVRGAALVLSSVYGEPAPGDEVYREEERYSLVNSIRHYADAGTLSVTVVNAGRPEEDVPVTVSVWNFGALRAIARRETDGRGRAGLSLGGGTYFVCAGTPEAHDWALADMTPGEQTAIELDVSSRRAFKGEFWLRYPEVN